MKNLINDFIEKLANDCERTQYYPKEKMIKNRRQFLLKRNVEFNKNLTRSPLLL